MLLQTSINTVTILSDIGLFAGKTFQKDEFVIEYIGETIREPISNIRERKYKKEGFGDCFMFRINKETVIDATYIGNQARYLNHSCDVNSSSNSPIVEVR